MIGNEVRKLNPLWSHSVPFLIEFQSQGAQKMPVHADADLVKRLRTEKGWSQEELANHAKVSKKTVENIEAGRPTYAGTLAKVARALGVEPKHLFAPERPPDSDGDGEATGLGHLDPGDQRGGCGVAPKRVSIEITIKWNLDEFKEEDEDQLFGRLKELLRTADNIPVTNLREGSVVLTVELTSEQANQLLQAVQAGALAKFGVLDARLVDTPREVGAESDATRSSTLLERVRGQDQQAWQQLVFLFDPDVYGWCRKGGLLPQDAADVRQEVFTAVYLGLPTFRQDRSQESFRGWLYGITRHKINDRKRKAARQPAAQGGSEAARLLAEVPEPEYECETPDEMAARVHRALELLRPHYKEKTWEAARRVTVEGQTPAEVAAALGMTPNAVYIAKSRVLHDLREEFRDLLGNDPPSSHMPLATCPGRDELMAFATGALSSQSSEVLAEHLETCPKCQADLNGLKPPDDPLLAALAQPPAKDPFEGVAADLELAEEESPVRRALELLRPHYKEQTWEAFWRVTVEGQTPEEVATALGMTTNAVRSAKSRVLRRLREEFGDLLGNDPRS
jgi:RNA polymerase sigma-70 factor (ECF subfamily)